MEASHGRPEVRDALRSLHTWLGHQLDSSPGLLREKVVHAADGRRVTTLDHSIPSEPVADLEMVQRRAQWKGDALRFALERRSSGGESAELKATEEKLRTSLGSLPECYPWMLDGPMPLPADGPVGIAADAYDALARVAEVAHELEIQSAGLAPASDLLYLMAEAQSGVLVAVRNLGLRGDSDQRDLFAWLKDQTTRHRVYVDRHMRLDNPADPTKAKDLLKRINEGSDEFSKRVTARKERGTLLNKLRYHASRAQDGELLDADRESITSALEQWGSLGFATRDRTLVELAQELAGSHADDQELIAVLTPFLEGQAPKAAQPGNPDPPALPERDLQAESRDLLVDISVAGMYQEGEEVDFDALEEALCPKALIQVAVKDLGDADAIRTVVSGLDTELILLGVRLEPDAYSALKEVCTERELLFVRLPDGYSSDQVAKQVLRQVGWRLRKDSVES